MGGFASLIGGFGQQAGQLGEAERQRRFQHQENELYRWQQQHQALADAVERAAGRYQGDEGERLRDLQMEVNSLRPGTDLTPYYTKYSQHRQKAAQEVAQAAAQGAQPPRPIPQVAPVSPPVVAPPFAPMMVPPAAQAAPAPSGAAMPSTSPVQPAAQGGASGSAAPFQPPAQPGAGSGGVGPSVPPANLSTQLPDLNAAVPPAIGSGLPAILPQLNLGRSADAFNNTGYIDPVIEAMLQPEVNLGVSQQKLQMVEPYLRELDKENPLFGNMMRMEILGGGNASMAPLLNLAFSRPITQRVDADTMSEEQRVQAGLPPDASGNWILSLDRLSRQPWAPAQPLAGAGRRVINPDGTVSIVSANERGVQGVTASQVAPKVVTDAQGRQSFVSPTQAASGQSGIPIPGAVNPQFVPQTSTQVSPGSAPITTTRQRGAGAARGGGGGGLTPPPAAPGGGAAVRMPSDSFPAAIQTRAKQVATGEQPLPTGRDGAAVQQYMAEHGMQVPSPMTAAGQKDMAQIDPLILEVQELKQRLEQAGLQNNDSHMVLPGAYAKYRIGFDTPYNDLFTGLSFESLRSAAAALKGSGSRAYPILSKALVHTPNLPIDTPKNIYEKLKEIEKILYQSRNSILADERKSGVIAPIVGAPQTGPAPANAEEYLKSLGR